MSLNPSRLPLFVLALAGTAALLTACNGKGDAGTADAGNASAPAGPPAAAPAASAPPVGVTTVRAQQRDLPVLITATGAVFPLASVDVRPQVTSVVTGVHIREGQFVKAGDLLFTLDARVDEANLAKARAQQARDQAALADAQRQLVRSKDLLTQNFISQGALDTNQTLVDSSAALIASDRAAIDAARVAVSYARITAPSAGRVGAIVIYRGSSVQANQTTLVTVTQLDPISVAFSLPQRYLADALDALKGGGATVNALLPDAGGTLAGRLQFVDSAVDAATGTVKVKALFPNASGKLWPGAFVNVAMTVRVLKDAVVVPQASIIQSPRGPIVYAVQDGRALARPVQLQYAQGDDAAVTGVRPGEHVVLDGRQNLRPGVAVAERAREGGRGASAAAGGARVASAGNGLPGQPASGAGDGAASQARPPAP